MGRTHSKFKNLDPKSLKSALIVLGIGALVVFVLTLKNRNVDLRADVLERDEEKDQNVKLKVESIYGEEVLDLEVLSRTLSAREIESMKGDFITALKMQILDQNESFSSVTEPLKLADTVEGYPFDIEYRIRPRGLIDSNGNLSGDIDEKTEFEIEITYSLDEFEEKETINGIILPAKLSEEEAFSKKIRNYLDLRNVSERNEKTIELPEYIDGVDVKWEKQTKNKVPTVMALTVLCAFLVLFKDKFSAGDNEKKRREKIILEYPDFAVKYALLNEAGLTHAQVVDRLAREYKKSKKDSPLYEEIYKANEHVRSGYSLAEALNGMAKECKVREISFFAGMINRKIKKGGKISDDIRKAAGESTSERREKIKKKAETAGTKLLLPMVLLLLIVFVLIMIPAFESFSFG